MSNVIQFKRNPGVTGPTTSELVAGEPAIAMDGPTGANSKLYIGISDSVTGSTTSVVPIGGAYYTNYIDSLVTGGVVNTVNGLTGNVTLVDLVGVSTYNGVSGAVEGVSSVNGITGDVEILDGVLTFNGATGNIIGVSSVNGATGAVTNVVTTSSGTQSIAGVKTFSDGVIFSDTVTGTDFNGSGTANFHRLGFSGTEFTASAVEINTCCDGNTTASFLASPLTNTDAIIVNDGGTMKQVQLSYLENWAETNIDNLPNVTAVGTLTSLTVDNIFINGNTIGHTVDTDLISITGGLMTVAGNISLSGNILLGENAVVGLDGAEKITFHNDYIQINADDVQTRGKISHLGDADTFIKFNTDEVIIRAGGTDYVQISSSGLVSRNLVFGSNTIGHTVDADLLTITGGTVSIAGNLNIAEDGYIGVGSGDERIIFDGDNGDISLETNIVYIKGALAHTDDPDTKLTFGTDTITLRAGGTDYVQISSSGLISRNLVFGSNTIGHTVDTDLLTITGGSLTVAGDISLSGDILLPEDGVVQIGGDTEKIVFNGAGSGSSSIDIFVSLVDFGAGSGCKLRSAGDTGTYLQFANDSFGSGRDGFNLYVDDTHWIDISSQQGVNFLDNEVLRPKLKDYSETVNAIGSVNSNTAVDFENGNVQTVTVAGNCEFSFSNPPTSDTAGTVTLIITNGGGHTTTWHSSVKWPSGVAPSLTTSGSNPDIITFLTTDAGTTVYGFVGGLNFS
tara:strand:+ start:9720 stop:11924 length:2205 start_codon:yes stop_codon:yes gene_type:complete